MLTVPYDNKTIHARVDGAENSDTILLINSLGTDLRMWDSIAADLAKTRKVVRFDKPGHGLSDTLPRPYRIEQLAEIAFAVLDAAGADKVDILGLSIGGQIAMAMYADQPQRINKIILSNTAMRIGTPEMWGERVAGIEQNGLAAMTDSILERWFSAEWRAANPALLNIWRNMLGRVDLDGYLGCCEALAAADFTATCKAMKLPVLAIAGGADLSTPPELVKGTADAIPNARFETIDGVGHIPSVEQPQAYLAQISEFLAQ